MEWFEVKYTDEETLEDYSTDIKAESAESAKRIFESEHKSQYKVWAVYGKQRYIHGEQIKSSRNS